MPTQIALIGFGEAGATFAQAAGWRALASGYDIDPARGGVMQRSGVAACDTPEAALAQADVVLSLVTASAALPAAQDYACHLRPAALWCDMNSAAPDTKRAAAAAVTAAGAHYVDVAVMAPVDKKMATPLLISGADAKDAADRLGSLGFTNVRVVGAEIGQASAIKLCRSIMVKGIEALTAEMVLCASDAGVLDEVLTSLDASETRKGWQDRADYNLDRMLLHGRRRSDEMFAASEMIAGQGISPIMTDSTVQWQQGLGELDITPVPGGLAGKIAAIMATPHFKGRG